MDFLNKNQLTEHQEKLLSIVKVFVRWRSIFISKYIPQYANFRGNKIVFDVIRGPNHDVKFSKILLVDDFLK